MYRIVPGANAKNFNSDLYDRIFDYMGGSIRAVNEEESPIPWDADIEIQGGNLVLSGHAGPNGYGSCVVKVPLRGINTGYFIELYEIDPDDVNDIIKAGWGIKEV